MPEFSLSGLLQRVMRRGNSPNDVGDSTAVIGDTHVMTGKGTKAFVGHEFAGAPRLGHVD